MNVGKTVKGVGLLIGLYLVIYNASKAGTLITSGSKGGVSLIRTLQGR